jgi:hypothetical protein
MSDDCVGSPLAECPICGAIGLPERVANHDCRAFRASTAAQWPATATTQPAETTDTEGTTADD